MTSVPNQPENRSPPAEELLASTYQELRRIAAAYLRDERPGHTLQPTALVHEAWCRLSSRSEPSPPRDVFIAAAAMTMRRILVDHARTRNAAKRGGQQQRIPLSDDIVLSETGVDLLELDEALDRLRGLSPCQAQLVELRFFAGVSLDEAAALIGMPARSVDREWACAKAWLWNALGGDDSLADRIRT